MSLKICDVMVGTDKPYLPQEFTNAWVTLTRPPYQRFIGCRSMEAPWTHFVDARAVRGAGTVRSVPLPYPVCLFKCEIESGRLLGGGVDFVCSGDAGLYTGFMTMTLSSGEAFPSYFDVKDRVDLMSKSVSLSIRFPEDGKPHSTQLTIRLEGLEMVPRSLCPAGALKGPFKRVPTPEPEPVQQQKPLSSSSSREGPSLGGDSWLSNAVSEFRRVFMADVQ